MFTTKLGRKVEELEKEIRGEKGRWISSVLAGLPSIYVEPIIGVKSKIVSLEKDVDDLWDENTKLKAIVAELCDYVYRDEK